ncbi:MAG: MFS transporter [Sedimentisphaerales bacterium]|nr:MFS transporter [Sedimentisphaerales bacterium]
MSNGTTLKPNSYPSYRWIILTILFLATLINYYDRVVYSITVGYLKEALQIGDLEYGYGVTSFQFAYMIGFLIAGRLIDLMGTRSGLSLSMFLWSLAGGLTAVSKGPISLSLSRGVLGFTQASHFPAANKCVAEWFPSRQRAFAFSLVNCGPSIAIMTCGIIVTWIVSKSGLSLSWKWAYYLFSATGIVLSFLWLLLYRSNTRIIRSDENKVETPNEKVRWVDLVKVRQTWGIMICKFCGDPVWWFYLSWLPAYLLDKRGFDLKGIAYALPIIYGSTVLIGVVVGWVTGWLIKRGMHPLQARKRMMLICAACMPISALAGFTGNGAMIILLVALACSAHTGWSNNNFSLVSDCVKKEWVGSTTGLAGFAGAVGGVIITGAVSTWLITTFGYAPIFILMGSLHPIAVFCLYLFVKPETLK